MGYTIDVDTGGTFTDGFLTDGREIRYAKVPTTSHDLTVCFFDVIKRGAELFEVQTEDLLANTDVVRYSTTVGTNTIIQRTGPKLGVLVTRGYEQDLYGSSDNPLKEFVEAETVLGIGGPSGEDADTSEILHAVETLVDRGARVIVVSLRGASEDPEAERVVRRVFEEEYRPHYLGVVPLLLSTELTRRGDDETRTATAVTNAYLHRDMVRYLYKADENLRNAWYTHPLLITHSSGGTARVAKTMALNTYNSGPAAGMLGSAHIARRYGLPNLMSTDMGGTSLDIGVIIEGAYDHVVVPEVEGIKVEMPMIEVKTIGAGGGSIAWIDPATNDVEVGPQSAGAQPGPAAFDLGGTEPTVTDADIVLGYIDPGNFLGGRMKLDPERAHRAVKERIADPLSLQVDEAALRIKSRVDENIGLRLRNEIESRGRSAGEFALLAYGGAGATHCCGYARALGVDRIITFPYSAVFSAFGSSTADVMHYYTHSEPLRIVKKNGEIEADVDRIAEIVDGLNRRALHDLRGEGFDTGEVTFHLDLVAGSADGEGRLVHVPTDRPAAPDDFAVLWSDGQTGSGEVVVDTLMLRARGHVRHWEMPTWEPAGEDSSAARTGERPVRWPEGTLDTPVYEYGRLRSGNVVKGPAVVESGSTTYVLPAGAGLSVDEYWNGIIEIHE